MYQLGAMQGWQCPLCKKIYGPFVQECLHCNNTESTITTTIGDDPDKMTTTTIDWTKHESKTWEKHIPQIY